METTGAAGVSTSTVVTSTPVAAATPPQASSGGAHAGATTETVNPGAWMSGFNDELKGYVSAKGFKGPSELANAYQNLEKLRGVPEERLLKLPEKFYDDAGKLTTEGRQIYERLGAPKDAKSYELDKLMPKENGDPKLMEHFSGVFAEAGIPKSAAEKIVSSWNEYQNQQINAMKEASAQTFKDQASTLLKDWGAAHDQNTQLAKEGVRRLGHDSKIVEALSSVLGHAQTMKLYHQLGSAVGESAFVSGRQTTNQNIDPGTARAQIAALKADRSFVERFAKGDAEAVAKLTKLHEMATHGQEVRFT